MSRNELEMVNKVVYFSAHNVGDGGENGRVLPRSRYVAIGANLHGTNEFLGRWLVATEGAIFLSNALTIAAQ